MRIKRAIDENEIGDVSMVRITSYDPSPPPVEYIKVGFSTIMRLTVYHRFLVAYLSIWQFMILTWLDFW